MNHKYEKEIVLVFGGCRGGMEVGLIARLRQMVVDTVTNIATSEKSRTVAVEDLLMPTGNAFRCPACNTLVQGEGFDVRAMAEEMAKRNMAHVPMCVVGM